MKKLLVILMTLMMVAMLAACGGGEEEAPAEDAATGDVAMQYMTADETAAVLGTDGYLVLDVRKAADYATSHITGSVSVDMDAAKEGDVEAGKAAMTAATEGVDDTLIIVCYTGNKYAQATTNALSAIGYDMSKVFTLEGGFNNWSEAKPDLVEAGDVAMQYMTADETAAVLGTDGYLVLDVRKAADYATAHITGSVSVDMDAAKEGDVEAGKAAMTTATEGVDDTLIIVCYTGNKYAQVTTNALSAIGYDMSKVFTLEGGFNNWSEVQPDLVEK